MYVGLVTFSQLSPWLRCILPFVLSFKTTTTIQTKRNQGFFSTVSTFSKKVWSVFALFDGCGSTHRRIPNASAVTRCLPVSRMVFCDRRMACIHNGVVLCVCVMFNCVSLYGQFSLCLSTVQQPIRLIKKLFVNPFTNDYFLLSWQIPGVGGKSRVWWISCSN